MTHKRYGISNVGMMILMVHNKAVFALCTARSKGYVYIHKR